MYANVNCIKKKLWEILELNWTGTLKKYVKLKVQTLR